MVDPATSTATPRSLVSTTETARLLDVSVDTLGKLLKSGAIGYTLVGRHRRLSPTDIERYLEKGGYKYEAHWRGRKRRQS
jgi:excisionase family DNA binding protein